MSRIALIDRPWLGYRSVMLATPLAAPPIERVRAVFADFLRRHPDAPLACRLDPARARWLPVPAAGRDAHVERIVRAVPDPSADLEAHIAAHGTGLRGVPFVAAVSPSSVMINGAHVLGDAVTLAQLLLALATADADGLAAIGDRARTLDPVRALARGVRAHGREWLAHVRHPATPPPAAAPLLAPPAATPAPAFAGTVLDKAALREITQWRNAHARGVSLTGVLTAMGYRALTAAGIAVYDGGFYALIDIRSQLPEAGAPRFGNLAKSLFLTAPLGDPAAVSGALASAMDTQRAVPAIVVASATSVRPHAPSDAPAAPLMLTFNSLPTLPGLADLPWTGTGKRFYGFGESVDAGGLTIFALRMRDHMQITASFDERSADPAAVRAALAALARPADLLEAMAPAASSRVA
jgi:hypothetical protein